MRFPHLLLMLAITVTFGFNFIATRYSVLELPALYSAALRFLVAFLVLFPFLRFKGGEFKSLLIASLVLGAGHFGIVYYALASTENVSSVVLATLTNVPFAMVLAVIFLGETIHWRRIMGLILSFAGVMVIAFDPVVFLYVDALLMGVLAAFFFAVGTILMRRLKDISALKLQAWVALISFPILFILSAGFEGVEQWGTIMTASWKAIGGILFAGIAATIIGHGGIYYLLQRYPVGVVSPLTLLAQVFAVLASVMILGEPLTVRIVLGGLMALAGAAIIVLRKPSLPVTVTAIDTPEEKQV